MTRKEIELKHTSLNNWKCRDIVKEDRRASAGFSIGGTSRCRNLVEINRRVERRGTIVVRYDERKRLPR